MKTEAEWMGKVDWTSLKKDDHKIRVALLEITPDLASQMLDGNVLNRTLRDQVKIKYYRDMDTGGWQFTGIPLVFTSDGELLDGQHRLYAASTGKINFTTLVVANVKPDARFAIDTGAVRKNPDLFKMAGGKDVNVLTGMTTKIYRWIHNDVSPRNLQVSFNELYDINERYKDRIQESISTLNRLKNIKRWGGPSTHAFIHFILSQVSRQAANEFYQLLESGDNLKLHSPIHLLRNLLIRAYSGDKSRRRTPYETMCIVLKAWNLWRDDAKITVLHWREAEGVPQIKGLPKELQNHESSIENNGDK